MTIGLLAELQALGVKLSVDDGRLVFDAPAGVMTDEKLSEMRSRREDLIAALAEPSVSSKYLTTMDGVNCPWCRSGDHLIDHQRGLRCGRCDREAWRYEPKSIVRCDWIEPRAVDLPIVSLFEEKTEPEGKRSPRLDPTRRLQGTLAFGS